MLHAGTVKFTLPFFILTLLVLPVWAGTFTFTGKTDKNPLNYLPGEKMVFSIQLLEDGKPVDGKKLTWKRRGDDGKTDAGNAVSSVSNPLVISTTMNQPGFVHINVIASDDKDSPLKNGVKNMEAFDGGAGVELSKIKGWPEPADFDAFWMKQKAKLAAMPIRADLEPVKSDNPEVLIFDVKVDCPGQMPVSGYFFKPKTAAPKSLPARVSFGGFGVASASKSPQFVDMAAKSLILNINAHGILNGQPAEYYQKLKETTLKENVFSDTENKDPETAYFNGTFLRIMRALEFIKTQPEWDGKTLIVSGGNQSGMQCLAAAGLDADVSRCEAKIPWGCDLGGRNYNRIGGSFPKWTDALGYYDAANHAKRIKCNTIINSDLGDYVCPPSSHVVLYNNISAPKKLEFQQGRIHMYVKPNLEKFVISQNWDK